MLLPFVPGSPRLATSVHKVEVEKIIHRIDECFVGVLECCGHSYLVHLVLGSRAIQWC